MDALRNNRDRLLLAVTGLCMLTGLAGCGDRMGDLREYTNQVKARKGGHI